MALTRRQKQIFDYINEFIAANGYSPSLEEIGRHFGLSSVATVHKHVTNLVRKGLLRRSWNQNRSIEVVNDEQAPRAVDIPLLGRIPAGKPVEAHEERETLAIPSWLVGAGRTYALKVAGDSMIDEQIRDGDYVVVEDRKSAENGEMVIALLGGSDVTLKKFYRDNGRIRLQPANATMQPIWADPNQVQIQGVVVGVMRKY